MKYQHTTISEGHDHDPSHTGTRLLDHRINAREDCAASASACPSTTRAAGTALLRSDDLNHHDTTLEQIQTEQTSREPCHVPITDQVEALRQELSQDTCARKSELRELINDEKLARSEHFSSVRQLEARA